MQHRQIRQQAGASGDVQLAVYHVRRSRRVARGSSARLRIDDVHPVGVVVRADHRFFSVAPTNLV